MSLRPGQYRAIQLFYDDGTPVIGPGGREIWITRCGAELLGNRTDGLAAANNIALRLGTRVKTVRSRPVGPVPPGGGGTVIGPGGGLAPFTLGGGQGFGGDEPDTLLVSDSGGEGSGDGPGILAGGRIVRDDREVWVVKPCTRTPGPPLGPFPLGNHVSVPLGATYDDGTGARAVYADGCVECIIPVVPPCGCYPNMPEYAVVYLEGPVEENADYGDTNLYWPRRAFAFRRSPTFWQGTTIIPIFGLSGAGNFSRIDIFNSPPSDVRFIDLGSFILLFSYRAEAGQPLCELTRFSPNPGLFVPPQLRLEGQCRPCGLAGMPTRILCTVESAQCPCFNGITAIMTGGIGWPNYHAWFVEEWLGERPACGDYRFWQSLRLMMACLGTESTTADYLFYPYLVTQEQGGQPVNYVQPVVFPRVPAEGERGQSRLVFSSLNPFMMVYEADMLSALTGTRFPPQRPLWRGNPSPCLSTVRFTLTEAPP